MPSPLSSPLRGVTLVGMLLVAGLTGGCLGQDQPLEDAKAKAWPEGSALFDDPRWLSGDGATTVQLPDDRILWLFGDSRVAPDGERSQQGAFFVSNTLAIQEGLDPSDASVEFLWREQRPEDHDPLPPPIGPPEPEPEPRPFIPDEQDGQIAHWPGHAAVVDGHLILFYTRIDRGEGGAFGFESAGWRAFLVEDPSGDPLDWQLDEMRTDQRFGLDLHPDAGDAFVRDGHLLSYAIHSTQRAGVTVHQAHLARWPVDQVLGGDLTEPEWFHPDEGAWVDQAEMDEISQPLFRASPGLTVHHDERLDRWAAVHTRGFPQATIVARTAPAPTGPFSGPIELFEPPENDRENVTTYLAFAHPMLTGADLVVGYSTGALDEEAHQYVEDLGQPRLVRVGFAEG